MVIIPSIDVYEDSQHRVTDESVGIIMEYLVNKKMPMVVLGGQGGNDSREVARARTLMTAAIIGPSCIPKSNPTPVIAIQEEDMLAHVNHLTDEELNNRIKMKNELDKKNEVQTKQVISEFSDLLSPSISVSIAVDNKTVATVNVSRKRTAEPLSTEEEPSTKRAGI